MIILFTKFSSLILDPLFIEIPYGMINHNSFIYDFRIKGLKMINQNVRILPADKRGESITVYIDGKPVKAFMGETIAAVILASGYRIFRRTEKKHDPRGIFCNQGICFECLVTVSDELYVRACTTLVVDGMVIETGSEVNG